MGRYATGCLVHVGAVGVESDRSRSCVRMAEKYSGIFFFLFSLLDRKLTGRSVLIMFRERWNVIKY
jgi:hypothetical protein